MSDPRVIKKYPNRRLYDTVESRYITLADVRRLVVEKIDFVVVDKKNNVGHHAQHFAAGDRRAGASSRADSDSGIHGQRDPLVRQQPSGPVSGHLEQALKQFLSQNQPVRERAKPFAASGCTPRLARRRKVTRRCPPVRIRDNEKDREESNLTK